MELFEAASACRECPGVVPGSAVLGLENGPIPCPVLFIGEAPGRLGAGRTGVPFVGDESGRRFEALLSASGLDRRHVFVTNALLCLPLDAAGRNRRPRMDEVSRCSRHLAATVEAVDPAVVVTLGAVALASLERIEAHGLSLKRHVALALPWSGRTLVPLYHPGRQAQLHRSWALQLADWKLLVRTVSTAMGATLREASDRQAP